MFSRQVLDRFRNPRFAEPLTNPTHQGTAGTPGDGPYMRFSFRMEEGRVLEASFETFPCPAAIACGSLVAEIAVGRESTTVLRLTESDIALLLGGLPVGKEHCPQLAVAAIRDAFGRT